MTKRFSYQYARPALTADCVVFGIEDETLKVLLIRRDRNPFGGRWALPGGFVELDESLEHAARRELEEETGLCLSSLEQFYAFGQVDRDPRDRVVTVAYYALVNPAQHSPRAADDAREAGWFSATRTPPLAFDHAKILKAARDRLRTKIRHQPIGLELLEPKFTLRQLQHLYEVILAQPLNTRVFQKRILALDVLVALDERETGVARRPARLYRFDKRKYRRSDSREELCSPRDQPDRERPAISARKRPPQGKQGSR